MKNVTHKECIIQTQRWRRLWKSRKN